MSPRDDLDPNEWQHRRNVQIRGAGTSDLAPLSDEMSMDDWQTAITSLYFQYGTADPAKRTPNYWRQITTGDWDGAYANLMDFKDKYGPRRWDEAALLKVEAQAGRLPRPTRAGPGG